MGKFINLLFCIFMSNFLLSSAQNCNSYSFTNNAIYATCVTLPVQNSHLYWNYHASNGTVDVAYRHTGVSSGWVAWALNVDGAGMVGAQALVALFNSNGSVQAYTSAVTGYATGLQQSPLSFDVPAIRAESVNGDAVIYATLVLPTGRTNFNQVWQMGPVANGAPSAHNLGSENRNSLGTVDFVTGQAGEGGGVGGSLLHRRNTHGVLNAVSWGILMPMGAMIARYLKVFKVAHPAWFYIHIAIQVTAYGLGVAGWGTGLKLGSDSVFALLLRPKPDHKYRMYWNIYHVSVGYTVISLGITNVFKGLDILDPEKKWKNAYIGVLISLAAIAVILEAFTWFIVLKRKKEEKQQGPVGNGAYGANGYGHGQAA
ncbi:cytochrome b561/ferric reductase transmembrane [Cynara cardunculus var. scolymus]|uniref:Cytochrome b561/ferric reductase transmembrane n=1 Tax=Cynara cardunculus var. scolymus TaxID=59895 RepID=A0A118K156_CYNCS|nr:cytochrome b561/ferric reductase transmembrane [Cynara cardunculus var. scolymus]